MVCTWLREIYSCSCLSVLRGTTFFIGNKICKPFFPPCRIGGIFEMKKSSQICLVMGAVRSVTGLTADCTVSFEECALCICRFLQSGPSGQIVRMGRLLLWLFHFVLSSPWVVARVADMAD